MAATAGLGGVVGRRPLHNTLLIAGLVFTAFDAIGKLQFGPEHGILSKPAEAAVVYGLFALLAVFVAYDELTSPQSGPAPLVKRILLPGMTFLATMIGFLLAQAAGVSPALALGFGIMVLALALRVLPEPIGFAMAGAGVASMAGAAGLALTYAVPTDPFGLTGFNDSLLTALKGAAGLGSDVEGGMLQAWPVEAGVYGAGAMAAAVLLLIGRLALSADRRKTPSRGLALAGGAAALTAFAGGGGAGPAACATLAVFVGLSCAYSDRLRVGAKRSARRSSADASAFTNETGMAMRTAA
jgi:hypothetical protein